MGTYINPKTGSKEDFLREHGLRVYSWTSVEQLWETCSWDHRPVVLVDNGAFTAAGVAYCLKELRAFLNPRDPRTKTVYYCPIIKLRELIGLPQILIKHPTQGE